MTHQDLAQSLVTAAAYSFDDLADIYNRTRVDYIVPMPMDARGLQDYIRRYDVALDASFVSVDSGGEPTGVGMLARRDARSWITRLGVMPERRGAKTGHLLMAGLMDESRRRNVKLVQLEVIKGNVAAYKLFSAHGFETTRELIVVRRDSLQSQKIIDMSTNLSGKSLDTSSTFSRLAGSEVSDLLEKHTVGASWVEESRSILQSRGVFGLRFAGGGWVIFHARAALVEHVVIGGVDPSDTDAVCDVLTSLLRQFHAHAFQVENIPADSPLWPAYQRLGFTEAFRRYEMTCALA